VDLTGIQGLVEGFSYPAVLVLLTAAGMGAPLSEDLILVVGGLVAARSGASLPLMMLTAWLGLMIGDSLLFRIGARCGPRAAKLRGLRRVLTAGRVEAVNRHFGRYGAWTIFVVRFCIGLRLLTFLTAGMSGMRYRRFIVADGLAAAIYAPLLVWLGHRFGRAVLDDVQAALAWLLAVVVFALAVGVGVRLYRRRAALRSGAAKPF
jgi:membrane-associated protein